MNMGKLFDSVSSYLKDTPKETLERDWERIKHLNETGVDVIEYYNTMYHVIQRNNKEISR